MTGQNLIEAAKTEVTVGMIKKAKKAMTTVLAAMCLMLSACLNNEADPANTFSQQTVSTPQVDYRPTVSSEATPGDPDGQPNTSDTSAVESSPEEATSPVSEDSSVQTSDTGNVTEESTTEEKTEPSTAVTEVSTPPATEKTTEATTTEAATVTTTEKTTEATTTEATTAAPLQPSPATVLTPVASGTKTEKNALGVIDYSNTSDGYVMVKYTGDASKVKVQVTDPGGVTQTYNLNTNGNYEVFPLTGGDGSYTVLLAENISGTSYAVAGRASISVSLSSSLAPFLRPNQYVNYSQGDTAVKKASNLCAGTESALEKVDAVYSWLVDNVSYDKELAANLGSGYLPDTSKTINKKIGICLDYAGTMAAMLRSQNVPTKLVVGYAGTAYHAWISVYCKDVGWVYGVIYFDGSSWHRMDPTFAASSDSSDAIMNYIGDGSNYSVKYVY